MSKLNTIQILRGIAATLVVCFHMGNSYEVEGNIWNLRPLFLNGNMGVDIFFVISGFIIYIASTGRNRRSVKDFLENRFWRIMPPYWAALLLWTAAIVGLAVVMGDSSKLVRLDSFFFPSFFLLPPMEPSGYVLRVAWTLSLEILFYLVFAFTFLRYGLGAFLAAMASWYLAGLAGLMISGDLSGWAYPLFNPVIGEFALGVLVAHVFVTYRTRYHGFAFAAGLALLAILVTGIVEPGGWLRRETLYGIPSAILVYGAAGMKWQWTPGLVLWGESSYLLYLLHGPFINVVGRSLEEVAGYSIYSSNTAGTLVVIAVVLICCLLTAWFERPYQRWYKARLARKRAGEIVAGVPGRESRAGP